MDTYLQQHSEAIEQMEFWRISQAIVLQGCPDIHQEYQTFKTLQKLLEKKWNELNHGSVFRLSLVNRAHEQNLSAHVSTARAGLGNSPNHSSTAATLFTTTRLVQEAHIREIITLANGSLEYESADREAQDWVTQLVEHYSGDIEPATAVPGTQPIIIAQTYVEHLLENLLQARQQFINQEKISPIVHVRVSPLA